ncbi:MAG: hypothetical protein AAB410_01820 [Patescibacteria group bacterium]
MSGKKINITVPVFSNLFLKLTVLLNRLLVLLQLRERRRFWGVVYDSLSKQPLDPVKVSLVYADTGKVEGACITDLEGRYGFLARPGKFKIFAQRTNYIFPSKFITASSDGIYSHLYHGEFFNLSEGADVVAPNIPMDPQGEDWNQHAKQGIVYIHFYFQLFFKMLVAVLFWFGFIYLSAVAVLQNFKSLPALAGVGIYFFVFLLELWLPKLRLFGVLLDGKGKWPISGVKFELLNRKFPGMIFGSAVSREDGKFFLRANPGQYILQASDISTGKAFGKTFVRVGSEGVVNQTIVCYNG